MKDLNEKKLKKNADELPPEPSASIKELRAEVKQLKERLALAEIMNDASIDRIVAFDTDMRIIYWNKTSELVTQIPAQDTIGKQLEEIFPEINNMPEITKAMQMALKGHRSFVPADKESYDGNYCEHYFVPLLSADDEVIGILNIIHDIAHRIKIENELKALNKSLTRKNKELRQKNSELQNFTTITSHDLKEPLRKIYAFIELILNKERDNISGTSLEHFKRVQAAARRMGLLTDDIISYANIDKEQALTSVDLNDTLEAAKKQLRQQIADTKAIISAEQLPTIHGYHHSLVQLFYHIISNAIKFSKQDTIPKIKVSTAILQGSEIEHTDALAEHKYICISFTDNGIGFDIQYSDRIFRMFQRLHSGSEYKGTGIGLAICKKIAELHHGFITVESAPAKGSTFHCYLQVGLRTRNK